MFCAFSAKKNRAFSNIVIYLIYFFVCKMQYGTYFEQQSSTSYYNKCINLFWSQKRGSNFSISQSLVSLYLKKGGNFIKINVLPSYDGQLL